jgi:hypothetical protein
MPPTRFVHPCGKLFLFSFRVTARLPNVASHTVRTDTDKEGAHTPSVHVPVG